MTSPDPYPWAARSTTLGPLLTQLRLAHGWSQLDVADRLCRASGLATLSRHEISRWERQQRVPGDFWLGWLATVLDVPLDHLTAAATATRRDRCRPVGPVPAATPGRQQLIELAHTWLADPNGPLAVDLTELSVRPPGRLMNDPLRAIGDPLPPGSGTARADDRADDRAVTMADITELRRLDDLVGGLDLVHQGLAQLARARSVLASAGAATRRSGRSLVATAGQLAGWLAADAGAEQTAWDAYRLALVTAAADGDRYLAAHVLGSASHLLASLGDAAGALILAQTGYAGARRRATPGVRALLLHRIAFAAALDGRHRAAQTALTAARRATDRRDPAHDPPWLYWLDDTELSAMTGRCLAALRRPLRAEPLLVQARHGVASGRSSAIYGAWLARTYLHLGEVEQACVVADAALLDAVRAGSARAATELERVRRQLAPHRDEPAVRQHTTLVAAAHPYLPTPPTHR
ncbi:helix-turn-helix domain-containing protein [Micromonospora sp. NPDC003197]